MRNSYNSCLNINSSIIIAVFSIFVLVSLLFQNGYAQSNLSSDIYIVKNSFVDSYHTKAVKAEGIFVVKNGSLDEVKSFSLKMSIGSSNIFVNQNIDVDSLDFKLTHVMILPQMKMIHIIGVLDVSGVSKRTEFDFNYVINEDLSLSLIASKTIKIRDFKKDIKLSKLASKQKNANDINLNLQLLFKQNTVNYLASN